MGQWAAGIFQNLIADAIVAALVAGGVVSWLQRRGSSWLKPVLYGLGAAALVLVSAAALILVTPKPSVTPENIESTVTRWLEHYHIASQKQSIAANQEFERLISLDSGTKMVIYSLRSEENQHYLYLQVTLGMDNRNQDTWSNLPDDEKQEIIRSLEIEASRSKTTFKTISNTGMPFKFTLVKVLFLPSYMTESEFFQNVDNLDSTSTLLMLELSENINRATSLKIPR